MPTKQVFAKEFLQDLESHGERLVYARDSQKIILQSEKEEKRVPLWRLDVMIFQFLAAHTALAHASVSEVLDEVLSTIM